MFIFLRMRAEIDEVLGSRDYINNTDLNQLAYTGCVFKETLRKWPPIPEIARLSKKRI